MLRREAAAWMARLQSRRDPEIERKFHNWRDRDPAHAQAFERVSNSYQQAGLLRYSMLPTPQAGAAARPMPSRAPRYALAAAAALVLLLSAGIYLRIEGGPWMSGTEAVMLSTSVGEIRSVNLSDGSKVTLDTDTRVEVEISRSGRLALVRAGRARFDVSNGPTPFLIEAGAARASVAGAVLDVEKFGDRSSVDVLKGSAKVAGWGSERGEQRLGAGETMTSIPAGDRERLELASGPDWTRGMLQFDGTPLEAAVIQANRYSQSKILLAPGLERQRVTGAFRASDVQGLARALAEAFHLSVSRTAGGNLVLAPMKAPAVAGG